MSIKEYIEYALVNPVLTFFIVWLIVMLAAYIVKIIFFVLPNRYFRAKNIRAHGWPPPHCDADGDLKPDKEKENL